MSDKKVELYQAFFWVCPECEIENFCKAIPTEPDQEDIDNLREIMNIDNPESEIPPIYVVPYNVSCSNCNAQFTTSTDDDEADIIEEYVVDEEDDPSDFNDFESDFYEQLDDDFGQEPDEFKF